MRTQRPGERARRRAPRTSSCRPPAHGLLAAALCAPGSRRRRGGLLGQRARRPRSPRPTLVEPAHEALAARAVEQHVQPGEGEVGARRARRRSAPRRSAAAGRRGRRAVSFSAREDRRRAAGRTLAAPGPRGLEPRAWARAAARSSRNTGGQHPEAAPDRRAQDRLRQRHLRQKLAPDAPASKPGPEPQHELRQVARAVRAAHLGVEGAQEAVRAGQRDRLRPRRARRMRRRPRDSRRSRAFPRVSRLSSIQTPVLSSIASRSCVTASESSPAVDEVRARRELVAGARAARRAGSRRRARSAFRGSTAWRAGCHTGARRRL